MSEEKNTKDLTLQDLMDEKKETATVEAKSTTNPTEKFKTVSIEDIAGPIEHKSLQQVANDEFMSEIDAAINRVKTEQFAPLIEEGKAMIMEKKLEYEEEEANKEQPSVNISKKEEDDEDLEESSVSIPVSMDIKDDEDIDDLEYDEETSEDSEVLTDERREEIINEFKQQIKAVIKPSKERPDISKFSIKTKGMSISKVLSTKVPTKHISNWVLPNSKRSITFSELSGTDIEKLNTSTQQLNRINTVKNLYNTIFEHVVDSNKPKSLEEWVKSISWFDTTHLYFAIYKACFENSNYVPHVCPNQKCNHTFIIKHAIEDMIKYKDEEAKAKIRKIFEKDSTAPEGVEANLVVISDNYAVALRPPSIYNVAFENAVLDEAFRNKYDESLSIISFIETIYLIDYETSELIPIDVKVDPEDIVKTIKYKIRSFHKILSKLSSDEFIALRDTVNKMMLDEDTSCTYVYPEVECPKCKTKIEEREVDPLAMVFTRHRLTTIANS